MFGGYYKNWGELKIFAHLKQFDSQFKSYSKAKVYSKLFSEFQTCLLMKEKTSNGNEPENKTESGRNKTLVYIKHFKSYSLIILLNFRHNYGIILWNLNISLFHQNQCLNWPDCIGRKTTQVLR